MRSDARTTARRAVAGGVAASVTNAPWSRRRPRRTGAPAAVRPMPRHARP
jgi:hypothetical protein